MKNNVTIFLLTLCFGLIEGMEHNKKRKIDAEKWEVNKKEKLAKTTWQDLPIELKTYIFSLIPERTSIEEIIEKLKNAAYANKEFHCLVKDLVHNPEAVINLPREYIENYPEDAQEEFMCAIYSRRKDTLKSLINGGINVNAKNSDNCLPIIRAAKNSNKEIVEMLLDAGADVNSRDEYEQTPLMHAVRDSRMVIIKVLLEAGADVNAKDRTGRTALMDVCFRDYEASKGDSKYKKVVEMLIKAGADVNAQTRDGYTALMLIKHGDIAQILLNAGANIDTQDLWGDTALIDAAVRGKIKIVKLLLNKGANPLTRNNKGYTALMAAKNRLPGVGRLEMKNLPKIIKILEKYEEPSYCLLS